MKTRLQTQRIQVGTLQMGGQNRVLIQSMCNIKTSKIEEVVKQINELTDLGADMMRVSIMDKADAAAIKEIKKHIRIPLIADIHFDYRLALLAIDNGIDKIRINPGNIGSLDKIALVVASCKSHHIPIRIGVNSGSLDKTVLPNNPLDTAAKLVASASKHVKILEELDFHDIVISLKGSNVLETIAAYRMAAEIFPYPLHLGITEAGTKDIGIIRSVAGLAPLLVEGIGDTIRISLSADPKEEIIAAKRLLHDVGLYPQYPTLISCPTCGRTEVDVVELAEKTLSYLEKKNKAITVAVMGCIVNGPGEAHHADIGLAGGRHDWVLFKKGIVVKTVKEDEAYATLVAEIDKM